MTMAPGTSMTVAPTRHIPTSHVQCTTEQMLGKVSWLPLHFVSFNIHFCLFHTFAPVRWIVFTWINKYNLSSTTTTAAVVLSRCRWIIKGVMSSSKTMSCGRMEEKLQRNTSHRMKLLIFEIIFFLIFSVCFMINFLLPFQFPLATQRHKHSRQGVFRIGLNGTMKLGVEEYDVVHKSSSAMHDGKTAVDSRQFVRKTL